MRRFILAVTVTAALAYSPAAFAGFDHCDTVEEITIVGFGCSGKLAAYCLSMTPEVATTPDGKAATIFEKYCVRVNPRFVNSARNLREVFEEGLTDASSVIEAALLPMHDASLRYRLEVDGEDINIGDRIKSPSPVITGIMSGTDFILVGRKENLADAGGLVFGTGRCSDTDEHEAGKAWRDITDSSDETYYKEFPSYNTIQIYRLFRTLSEKQVVCGSKFTAAGAEYYPTGNGREYSDQPSSDVIYIESGLARSIDRTDNFVRGVYSGIVVQFEYYLGIRSLLPEHFINDDPNGRDTLPMAGIFLKPERLGDKAAAACRVNLALEEASSRLMAGTLTKTAAGDYQFDEASRGAYEDLTRLINYDRTDMPMNNMIRTALTVKNQNGPGTDEAATEAVRQEFFDYMRQKVWRVSSTPNSKQLSALADWFGLRPAVPYIDPCAMAN